MTQATVTAIERAIDIFQAFNLVRRPMSLTELALTADIPKSSCHAIVSTLINRGYLYNLRRPRALYPTQRMYDVMRGILAGDPFLERMRPLLLRLRDESGETVILAKLQGEVALYIDVLEGTQSIRYSACIGDHKPLHSSAVGKALLGSMRELDLRVFVHNRSFPSITPMTLTAEASITNEIIEGRRRGYYVSRGENVEDVWAVAANLPINAEQFAVAIAGPRHRMEGCITRNAQLVVQGCRILLQDARRNPPEWSRHPTT